MKRLDGDDAALVSPRTRKTAARDIVQVCACGTCGWMEARISAVQNVKV